MKHTKNRKRLLYITVGAVFLLVFLRFGLFFLKSEGFSGLSVGIPLLLLGVVIFALCTSGFLAAWVYEDCGKRGDDPILWAIVVLVATPLIGWMIYVLRRPEIKRDCPACGHQISLRAKYCEECGTHMENKEDDTIMVKQETHHLKWIIGGVISMALMLVCLTGFIVTAAAGNNINTNAASNERVWNTGVIGMTTSSFIDGVWKLKFGSASEGFIKEQNMKIQDADTQMLHADISCKTVPDGATLVLWLVQGDTARSVDVTDLSEPLEYPLDEFENGKIHVRLQINGVKDTSSEIYIQ
ncbi:zinc ribbon domain-containing protein [Schaedlerella arabinosiphila]|uniref:Zinc ribbon domain-containing protein n=1 Tax=Schaedlerella arabinosiphila TaxID=2044587 RepID=A0A3R8L0Q0_9FIRM|nr:zinc ribbon domain-containing protein [Schaedlerella arabinosiphila]RRK33889.1 zinc ribbon domain-containing protein [Schaedlerella arabinosiphila]